MTPETKAKELIEKFSSHSRQMIGDIEFKEAKACALICVDEIFQFLKDDDDIHESAHNANSQWPQYWQSVKTEIEKT